MPGMEITNSFAVKADPDRVYEFLLDVNNVVSCVPGAELSEVVDPNTFKGKVRIKVGPVTVSYNGTARITSRDATTRTATLEAEGKETTGSGSAQATTVMAVAVDGEASTVTLTTDFTVVGRVAQFGRGIMEDVSRHLVGQAATCIQSKLEAPAPTETAVSPDAADANGAGAPVTAAQAPSAAAQPAALDAFAIGRAVAKERISRFKLNPKMIGIAFGGLVSLLLLRRLRRSRRRRRAMND
jgi:uncharacterized protein